jgi:hypothetical protein
LANLPRQISEANGAPLTAKSLGDAILALLPKDGTPVLNRVMRVMLSRQLAREIDLDQFFQARDLLLESGEVGRLRGQGGQLFLSQKPVAPPVKPPVHKPGEIWTEAQLMAPLGAYLNEAFRREQELPGNSEWIVRDTSRIGAAGRWARPDFIAVSATRFKTLPGVEVDVHSFELKTETGADMLAVHEALAQTRFTNYGHLVWHLPPGSVVEAKLPEIHEQCVVHGIGLIRMRNALKPQEAQILLDPVRKQTQATIVDDFLQSRLTPNDKKALVAFIQGKHS